MVNDFIISVVDTLLPIVIAMKLLAIKEIKIMYQCTMFLTSALGYIVIFLIVSRGKKRNHRFYRVSI